MNETIVKLLKVVLGVSSAVFVAATILVIWGVEMSLMVRVAATSGAVFAACLVFTLLGNYEDEMF